jgi:predicted DNA-binding transcriptional regulator YafY
MPLSKNAFFRYRIIDSCLRETSHQWTKKEITDKVNRELAARYGKENTVTEYQIRHDLDTLEYELHAPVERYPAQKPRYYRYADSSFSLFNLPLSPEDLAKLTHAMELLASVKGLEVAEEVQPIILYLQNRARATTDTPNHRVLHFDHQPVAKGTELIEDFLTSIQQKTPLKFEYKAFTETVASVVHLHPYLLKEYNNRWFCVGYCNVREKIMHIALDRIQGTVRPLKSTYIENTFFNPDTYFSDIIGVTRNNRPKEKVVLEFSAERAGYVRTKPLHHSQQIVKEWANGKMRVQIEVIPNKELIATLLSYGKDVKVLAPEAVKEEVVHLLESCLQQYDKH